MARPDIWAPPQTGDSLGTFQAGASVYERVVAILGELPAIGKDSRNEQQGFHYRSHDDVLNALNPLLATYGVFIVPRVIDRLPDKRTTRNNTVQYEVNLHVEYTFYGAGGDHFVASAWGEGTDSGDKSTNKAMTMAFKNVIAQTFAVSTQEGQALDADRTTPEATIDITRKVLPGGPTTPELVHQSLVALEPTVDWAATLAPAVKHVFGVESRQEIPSGPKVDEFWTRLANASVKMGDPAAFPTAGDHVITESIAWAFDGAKVEVVLNETVAAAEAELEAARQAALDAEREPEMGHPDDIVAQAEAAGDPNDIPFPDARDAHGA